MKDYAQKSSLKEIEARFDQDVERFSNLETGQQTTLDAQFNMKLIIEGILAVHPELHTVLDIGCGAGNFAVKLAMEKPDIDISLIDLSLPMLNKAKERLEQICNGTIYTYQTDFRQANLADEQFDCIIATAVLHHLRDDQDWETAFQGLYNMLKPGGSIWIFDLVRQEAAPIQQLIYDNYYGDYLISLKDSAYKEAVFEYIEKEDSPRSVSYQMELLKKVGFQSVDILHKNLNFSSFMAIK